MEDKKLKIFVSAYACEPNLGSEIGVGWHWVLEISKHFELWVLTRESNRHNIEPWIETHQEFADIHFLYYDWPKWARFWKKGLRGVRKYYNIWQFCTNRIVKRTMQENDIKIFHHLTYGNMLWKVSSFGQRRFFVWGPTGGLETIPKEFSKRYDMKSRVIEWVRRMVVKTLPMNGGFKRRCRNANLILCKTDISRSHIPEEYRDKEVLFTDVAVEGGETERQETKTGNTKIEYVTVGRLDAWRGFDLVIEGFAKARKDNQDIHLSIVGEGRDRERLWQIIKKLNIGNHVTMTGGVSMEEYHHLMSSADVVINASLKEGAVTVSFDSMTMGKPLICLDTTGYTRYFSNDYAIVIPVKSREQVIDDLGAGITRTADRKTRMELGEKAAVAGKAFSWESRGREFCELLSSRLS